MSDAASVELADVVFGLEAAPGELLAARLTGLYRSRDGGQSWQPLFSALAQPTPPPANAAASAPGLVLAGTPNGVLRSTDDGATWEQHALARPAAQVSSLKVSPDFARDGTVFAGTLAEGVFVSTDQGRGWQVWNIGLFDRMIFGLAVSPGYGHDRTVWAAASTGVYHSRNGGRLWQTVALPAAAPAPTAVALGGATGRCVAVGTERGELFVSNEGGLGWSAVPLPQPEPVQGLEFLGETLYVLAGETLARVVAGPTGWACGVVPLSVGPAAALSCLKVMATAESGPRVLVGDTAGVVHQVEGWPEA